MNERSGLAARQQVGLAVAGLAVVTFAAARLGIRRPVRAVFGLDCPGCGTRALLALMRGDVPQAARENTAALVAGLATAGYVIAPTRVSRAASVCAPRLSATAGPGGGRVIRRRRRVPLPGATRGRTAAS